MSGMSTPVELAEHGAVTTSLVALAAACVLALAALWVWRRMKPTDPGEAAFTAISRSLGLTRADRLLVRELAAAHGAATPVALLLSEHALKEAVAAARGIEDAARVEDLVGRIDRAARGLAA